MVPVMLGALIFAVLTGGLSLLMIVPLMFVVLAIAVFKEPSQPATPEGTPEAEALPEPKDTVVERPRTMVAGRRPTH